MEPPVPSRPHSRAPRARLDARPAAAARSFCEQGKRQGHVLTAPEVPNDAPGLLGGLTWGRVERRDCRNGNRTRPQFDAPGLLGGLTWGRVGSGLPKRVRGPRPVPSRPHSRAPRARLDARPAAAARPFCEQGKRQGHVLTAPEVPNDASAFPQNPSRAGVRRRRNDRGLLRLVRDERRIHAEFPLVIQNASLSEVWGCFDSLFSAPSPLDHVRTAIQGGMWRAPPPTKDLRDPRIVLGVKDAAETQVCIAFECVIVAGPTHMLRNGSDNRIVPIGSVSQLTQTLHDSKIVVDRHGLGACNVNGLGKGQKIRCKGAVHSRCHDLTCLIPLR